MQILLAALLLIFATTASADCAYPENCGVNPIPSTVQYHLPFDANATTEIADTEEAMTATHDSSNWQETPGTDTRNWFSIGCNGDSGFVSLEYTRPGATGDVLEFNVSGTLFPGLTDAPNLITVWLRRYNATGAEDSTDAVGQDLVSATTVELPVQLQSQVFSFSGAVSDAAENDCFVITALGTPTDDTVGFESITIQGRLRGAAPLP